MKSNQEIKVFNSSLKMAYFGMKKKKKNFVEKNGCLMKFVK